MKTEDSAGTSQTRPNESDADARSAATTPDDCPMTFWWR